MNRMKTVLAGLGGVLVLLGLVFGVLAAVKTVLELPTYISAVYLMVLVVLAGILVRWYFFLITEIGAFLLFLLKEKR